MKYKTLNNLKTLVTILVISAFLFFSFADTAQACHRIVNVTTNLEQATFTLYRISPGHWGNGFYEEGGTFWTREYTPPGIYTIIFNDIEGYITPPSFTQQLIGGDDQTLNFTGIYVPVPEYNYGINITTGDIDGDGTDEIIIGEGPNPLYSDDIWVMNESGEILSEFSAGVYDGYGVNVAAGDMDRDGAARIVTGTGPVPENDAVVQVFDGSGMEKEYIDNVLSTNYGANVAVGDLGLEIE